MKKIVVLSALLLSTVSFNVFAEKDSFISTKLTQQEACDAAGGGAERRANSNCSAHKGVRSFQVLSQDNTPFSNKWNCEVKFEYFCNADR